MTDCQTPYEGMSIEDVVEIVDRGYRMPRPVNCPYAMYEMMMKYWNKHSEHRPCFEYLENFF
ncbi:hypothetical protein DPMN_091878 [Dreissena polymorpha]|uniref:Serine-threonine/tyrosine-protein kinase catalytic domain-containing protein n=1 Tax=Dreissena polymorpha TaxID=45954 RepID=A0A9D4L0Y9_DREPO|nr:hypothetical protein DPMN_091878 [Dreissena polymorpha]